MTQHTKLPWQVETHEDHRNEQKHTTLPWATDTIDDEIYCEQTGEVLAKVVYLREYEANAEFIVKACNSHAKLVEALEEILRRFEIGQCDFDGCADLADEALQQLKENDNAKGE